MSYLDQVSKKMQKNKSYGAKSRDMTGTKTRDTVETNNFKGIKNTVGSKITPSHPIYVDPPLSRPRPALGSQKTGTVKSTDTHRPPPDRASTKRKNLIRTVIRAGTDGTHKKIKNTNRKSPRFGKYYSIEAGKGGNYHVYDNGKRVFVRSKKKHGNTNTPVFKGKGLNNKEYLIDA